MENIYFKTVEALGERERESCSLKNNKGITLIALVITIIILLMLAGISINMISGQDGILNKATESKEVTTKAQNEEKLNLIMAEYQLEKYSGEINLRDYVAENFPDATITEDTNSGCLQVDYNGERYIISSEGNVNKIEQAKNLVRNGFLEYKNNTNFISWTYNDNGFLSCTSTSLVVLTADYIEISHYKKYYQSVTTRTNNQNAIYYMGLAEFDVDKNRIDVPYVEYVNNTLTELAEDINDGDTVVYLNNLSNFKTTGENNLKGLIFWNYKDSTGYQYPELTYSRNVYGNLFEFENIDKEKNCITLNESWSNGYVQKGTKLSQSSSTAGTYNYGLISNKTMSDSWNTYTNIIAGFDENKAVNLKNFRAGTRYVKPVFLLNFYSSKQEATTDIKDIIFQEIE